MSMYIQGKIVGVVDQQGQSKVDEKTGQVTPGNYYGAIGIQSAGTERRFGFENMTTLIVGVYRDNYKTRLHDHYRLLEGQEVLMPVEVSMNKNAKTGIYEMSYTLAGLPLKPALEAFAPQRKSPAELVAQAQAARAAAQPAQPAQAPVAKAA